MTTPGDAALMTAVSVASSGNIIHILGKIDQVGKVITEVSPCYVCPIRVNELSQVHPYAKLAWTVLNAAQRVPNFLDNFDISTHPTSGCNCSDRP